MYQPLEERFYQATELKIKARLKNSTKTFGILLILFL